MRCATSQLDRVEGGRGGGALAARMRPCSFTLVEMLVSLAVLTVVLSVVGVVFTITTKTTSQAAAYAEVQNRVRQTLHQMDEDLYFCDPARSMLVMVGRTRPAALTAEDLEARKYHRVLIGDPAKVAGGYDPEFGVSTDLEYSDPRADILMFFTDRRSVSLAPPATRSGNDPPTLGDAALAGAKFAPLQVVWGHAAVGDPVWTSSGYTFPAESTLRHIDDQVSGARHSVIPANQWHLARRQAILAMAANKTTLNATFFGDEWRRITRCEPELTNPPMPGDMVYLDFGLLLAGYSAVSDPKDPMYPGPPGWSPYDFFGGTIAPAWFPMFRPNIQDLLYYHGSIGAANHHVATVLTEVPVELRSNLGVQMLPGCAWFQVEFLMPEDPRNSVLYSDPDPLGTGGVSYATSFDLPRWMSVKDGQTYVFVPDSAANREVVSRMVNPVNGTVLAGSRLNTFARLDQTFGSVPGTEADPARGGRIVRMWPYAVRITIHAYDGRGRLEQPIIRSIVHRFE